MNNENLKLKEQGYVYVILDEHNRVKIGKSLNPATRIKSIATSSGITIVDSYVTEPLYGYSDLENHLHDIFKEYRQIGEWFDCKFNDVITYIKTTDMSEYKKEQWYDTSAPNALLECLKEIHTQQMITRDQHLMEPLVSIIEKLCGVSNPDKNQSERVKEAIDEHQKTMNRYHELLHKFDYLVDRCDALEKLNECYLEEIYLTSEMLSQLEDTEELDALEEQYKSTKLDLAKQAMEHLKVLMKPYTPFSKEEI